MRVKVARKDKTRFSFTLAKRDITQMLGICVTFQKRSLSEPQISHIDERNNCNLFIMITFAISGTNMRDFAVIITFAKNDHVAISEYR